MDIVPLAQTLELLPGTRDDEIVLIWETTSGQLVTGIADIRAIGAES